MRKISKILVVLILIAFMPILTSCSTNSPEGTVKAYLEAVKNYDKEKIGTFGSASKSFSKDLSDFTTTSDSKKNKNKKNSDDSGDEIIKMVVENLSYEIVSSEEKDDTATVKVKITNKDYGAQMETYISKIIVYAFSHWDESEKKIEKYYVDQFKNAIKTGYESDATITKEVDVKLKKKDDKWEILENDKLDNAILGNMMEVINSFE